MSKRHDYVFIPYEFPHANYRMEAPLARSFSTTIAVK